MKKELINTGINTNLPTQALDVDMRYVHLCEAFLNDKKGMPRVVRAEEVRQFPRDVFRAYCTIHGIYIYPTEELVSWVIEQGVTLEVGSGNGVLARACGIIATDNYSQSPKYKADNSMLQTFHTASLKARLDHGQALTKYGANVKQIEGLKAVQRYKSKVVLGCSITHKSPRSGGSGYIFGLKEQSVLSRVRKYIMIGNEVTFADKPLLKIAHDVVRIEGLITRYQHEDKDCAFIWPPKKSPRISGIF